MEQKILSWNIRQGGGTRISQILGYIKYSACDTLILSEFQNTQKGTIIRKALLDLGYVFQAASLHDSKKNSVLIASKIAFNSTIYHDIDPEYSSNIIRAEFNSFVIYGCYLPHKKKHNLFDFLMEEIENKKAYIITGDLNSGINGVDQAGNSFWYEEELMQLNKKGIKDIFRALNGYAKEYSWYSHQGNGFRYDHFLGSEQLIPYVSSCYYEHSVREAKISDHSPMILEIKEKQTEQ